jgi:hypothetical protein
MARAGLICVVITSISFFFGVASPACAQGKRYALVVGVKTYRPNQQLPELSYTENDATGLAAVLKSGGYRVTLMTQAAGRVESQELLSPLSDYIRDQLLPGRDPLRNNARLFSRRRIDATN